MNFWLIERIDITGPFCLGICDYDYKWSIWDFAIRFSRKEDAEKMIKFLRFDPNKVKAIEHMIME